MDKAGERAGISNISVLGSFILLGLREDYEGTTIPDICCLDVYSYATIANSTRGNTSIEL
jgi:hypothetical protein